MKLEILEVIEKVHNIFKKKRLTLSVAESCTGGLISHYLTTLPGASTFFVAGIISYSEDVKKSILGISPDIIQRFGVVSEETAREMAKKVRLLTKTDCSLSTTGILGPDVPVCRTGRLEGKEQGLIYLAASKEGKTLTQELRLKGNRETNKEEASLSALKLLIELVEQNE